MVHAISGPKGTKVISVNTLAPRSNDRSRLSRIERLLDFFDRISRRREQAKVIDITERVLSGVKLSLRLIKSQHRGGKRKKEYEPTDSHRIVTNVIQQHNSSFHDRIVFLGILYRHTTAFYVLAGIYCRRLLTFLHVRVCT